jgi:hypothetical protein
VPKLDPGKRCFLPLTALAEDAQSIRLFVRVVSDSESARNYADCIELQGQGFKREEGAYRCSSPNGDLYLSLKMERKLVQVSYPSGANDSGANGTRCTECPQLSFGKIHRGDAPLSCHLCSPAPLRLLCALKIS